MMLQVLTRGSSEYGESIQIFVTQRSHEAEGVVSGQGMEELMDEK